MPEVDYNTDRIESLYQFTLYSIETNEDYIFVDNEGNNYTKDEIEKFPRADVVHIKVKTTSGNERILPQKIESNDYDRLIMKDGKVLEVRAIPTIIYLIKPEVYRIDKKFNLTTNLDLFDGFMFAPDDFSIISQTERLQMLKESNDDELRRLDSIRGKLKRQDRRIPNNETKTMIERLNTIRRRFEQWYSENNLPLNFKTTKLKSKTPLQLAVLSELEKMDIKKGVTITDKECLAIGNILVKAGKTKEPEKLSELISTIRKVAYRDLKYGDGYARKSVSSKKQEQVFGIRTKNQAEDSSDYENLQSKYDSE